MNLKHISKVLKEAVVEITKEYMKKEVVREKIYNIVLDSVSNGTITNQEQLDDFFVTIDMSVKALKMVPFAGYKALAKTKKP